MIYDPKTLYFTIVHPVDNKHDQAVYFMYGERVTQIPVKSLPPIQHLNAKTLIELLTCVEKVFTLQGKLQVYIVKYQPVIHQFETQAFLKYIQNHPFPYVSASISKTPTVVDFVPFSYDAFLKMRTLILL